MTIVYLLLKAQNYSEVIYVEWVNYRNNTVPSAVFAAIVTMIMMWLLYVKGTAALKYLQIHW